jgi:serine/threonine protein kinase
MNTNLEREAERIFEQTLDAPTADRPAVIAAACGDDAALLARVQALLSANRTDGFLAGGTTDAADPAAAPVSALIGEKAGDQIGPYKLLEKIGEGGFGVVFMAEQHKPVRRRVALKVIKLGMDTREVVARFEAERQALAMMDHPNIAKVFDAGATETGRPYFVMELVRGSAITDYCDKHKLPTAERVELLAQVCRAVQHAHSKGIIHRDLKPSNVLVTVTDDKPVPKVIDFGIAKATQAKLTDRTLFTGYRQLIGTPQYMSPEQADSDGSDIDTRSDVYSLGVMLYELLVGTTPHDPKALRSAAYEAMRKMIREAEPAKPSTRLNTLAGDALTTVAANRGTDARKLGQSLHGELDWIVMRALEKERGRRYETAAAMAEDLGRHLAGEAVAAGPPGGIYRFKKMVRRHRAAISVAAAVGVVLLLGIAGTTIGLVRETRQRQVAERARTEADKQRQLAEAEKVEADKQRHSAQAVVDFLTQDVLDRASLDKGSAAVNQDKAVRDVLIKELIEPAIKTLDVRLRDEPIARAAVQTSIGHTLRNLGRVDTALPLVQAALKTRREEFGEADPRTMETAREVVWDLGLADRPAEAEPIARQSMEAGRRVLGEGNPDTIWATQNYSTTLMRMNRLEEAERLGKQAYESWLRLQGPNGDNVAQALTNYGAVEFACGKYVEAVPLFKRQWELRSQQRGENSFITLQALTFYCQALCQTGRSTEAAPLLQSAVEKSHRFLGDESVVTQQVMGTYANVLMELHRPAEAEAFLRQVNDSLRQSAPDTPVRGFLMLTFARCLIANNKWTEAEGISRESWEWDKAHSDPTQTATPEGLKLLNQCLQHEGKPPEPTVQ